MAVKYSVFWILFSLSDAAITGTPPNVNLCDGEFANLKWAYDTTNLFAVEWKINGTLMLQYIPSQPINSQYTYSNGYTSAKLTHIANGEINITSLNTNDNGNYSCQTTYTSGSPSTFETQMVLTIYDMISTNLTCSYNQSADTIDCSVNIPSSITAVTINGADNSALSWPISGTKSETYTVCMKGNAANCRIDGIQQCISFKGRDSEVTTEGSTKGPISEMSTSIATARMTSINSISELSNTTLPMISGSTTTTSIETTNIDANTQTNEIQTNTLRIISNSVSTYQSMFVTTAVNDISGSLDSTSHMITSTFALPGYSTPSYNERTITSRFETSSVFPQSFSVNQITFSVDTLSDTLFHNLHVSSGSLITTDSSKYSMLSMTISPLMSTTLTAQISYFSTIGDLSFSYHQYVSEITVLLPKISENSPMSSAIIDTNNQTSHTTNNLITSYQDDTSISFDDFTDVFQIFSPDYAASASTSIAFPPNSTDHHLSLQTTEYYETRPTEFTSDLTTSLYESHTNSAAVGMSSEEIVTSGKMYLHTSMMPSQTQLTFMNDFKVSTTYFEPYSRSNDEIFSSDITLSTNLFLPFNTKANASGVYSYIKTTSMSTFESQSGILTMNLSLFINPSSIPITTVLPSFKTTWLTSTMYFNSKYMQSMIKPSSQQTNSGNSYIEIDSSFKDSSFFFSGSLTMNYPVTTSLSSGVLVSISSSSPNTIQSGLSEKHKTIIFITTSSAIITLIVVILFIILAKVYISKQIIKPRKEDDNISWNNHSSPQKAAFPDYSFTGKSIYPLLNTSSASFKMFHYEHHWNDIV